MKSFIRETIIESLNIKKTFCYLSSFSYLSCGIDILPLKKLFVIYLFSYSKPSPWVETCMCCSTNNIFTV